jgi:hypothetical protein
LASEPAASSKASPYPKARGTIDQLIDPESLLDGDERVRARDGAPRPEGEESAEEVERPAVPIEIEDRAGRTFFTHMAHDLGHAATCAGLPEGMALAYDGLTLDIAEGGARG